MSFWGKSDWKIFRNFFLTKPFFQRNFFQVKFVFLTGVCTEYWGCHWVLGDHWKLPVSSRPWWWALSPTGGLLGTTGELLGRTAVLLGPTAGPLGTAAGPLDTTAGPLGPTAGHHTLQSPPVMSSGSALLGHIGPTAGPSSHCWATGPYFWASGPTAKPLGCPTAGPPSGLAVGSTGPEVGPSSTA